MVVRSLNGKWKLLLPGTGRSVDATVPGWNYTDLLKAGVIEDPYWRDNALRLRWVQDKDWHYHREFEIPSSFLGRDRILLRCRGLDTFCDLRLNGRLLAKTDNMYRTYEFDVKKHLRKGTNDISAVFRSVVPYINRKYKERPLYQWGEEDPKRTPHYAYLRKAPYQFGWDWSPSLAGAGIWKDIELVGIDGARILEVRQSQLHKNGKVRLTVAGRIEKYGNAAFTVRMGLSFNGRPVAGRSVAGRQIAGRRIAVKNRDFAAVMEIERPELWWPNGSGDQPLYELRTELLDAAGTIVDTDIKKIGLRTIRLIEKKDRIGCSFFFEVNGLPVWGRGANWVPADCFPASISRERYRRLVGEMAAQNMNILRVWGGGLYESDDFYDACDETGILVWQDFMFACSVYPAYDKAYLANTRAEAVDNVRRLRHHASLCLWCGNNELEEGLVGSDPKRQMPVKDYNVLFDRLLPSVVMRFDPATPYIRSSGRAPGSRRDVVMARDVDNGDSHLWWVMSGLTDVVRRIDPAKLARLKGEKLLAAKYEIVWGVHNGLDKYQQLKILPRFASELGRQSFPVMKTVRSFTAPSDRNALHPVMEYRQMGSNAWMLREITERFMLPGRFEDQVLLSQIVQGEKFRWYVENWRRHRPRSMGALHWTCNDCWPAPEWSTVDYYLRRKASFYIFKRFYSPRLVTGEEDPEKLTCALSVVNDDRRDHPGVLAWRLTDCSGKALGGGSRKAVARACASTSLASVDLGPQAAKCGKENLMLWLDWAEAGRLVSSNLVMLREPKSMRLESPKIRIAVEKVSGDVFAVVMETDRPALWAWIEACGERTDWSDNYFHLRPGVRKRLTAKTAAPRSLGEFRRSVRTGSLRDFYP
jgi:beta-mannosidase